jgi:hypothetical protein
MSFYLRSWEIQPKAKSRNKIKGIGRCIWWECCLFMYESGKMRHVETIPGTGEKGNKGERWRSEFNYDIL